MMIFAMDSATAAGSAAIMRDGVCIAERYQEAGRTHSETLMPLCDEVFREAGLTPQDMDGFAITIGPGSFTGLRIGMGILKGMAFATGKPCVGVSTLEVLAHQVPPDTRKVVAVLDARRDRVYHACFLVEHGVQRLAPDGVIAIADLRELYQNEAILLIGDGAAICYNELYPDISCVLASPDRMLPHADAVARAALPAFTSGDTVSAGDLVPVYMQLPQAERERQERERKK